MTAVRSGQQLRLGYYQTNVLRSPARFKTLVAGRRFGKTTLIAVRSFQKAVNKRSSHNWIIMPTYRQAKEILWEPLKAMIPREYVKRKNESDLFIQLLNDSLIALKGADNPDSLRGPGLDDATFDEFADIDERTWPEVIRPALSDKQGTAFFAGTPKGFNYFYDLHLKGLEPGGEWESFQYTTIEGGRVPYEELLAAKDELDPRVFRQEFKASFETLAGRVYGNFERKLHLDPTIEDRGAELYVGMDFNINPMSLVIVQKVNKLPEVLDTIQIMSSDTEEAATELRRRYPARKLIVCPDASGAARHTSSPQGTTDFSILREHGMIIQADKSNPFIVDRINNVQSNLLSGSGKVRLKIHPRCKPLVKTLEGLVWKKGTNLVDKTSGLDHMGDALGYVLWQEFNIFTGVMPRVAPDMTPLSSPFEV